MWVLIFWMGTSYSMTLGDAAQPTLQMEVQEFRTETACKDAFASVKKLNNGDLMLRGVCTPKGD